MTLTNSSWLKQTSKWEEWTAVGKIGNRLVMRVPQSCFHVCQGKRIICQGKVSEMSGNFKRPSLWQPCRRQV